MCYYRRDHYGSRYNHRGHTALDSLREEHEDSDAILDSIVDTMFSDITDGGDHELIPSFDYLRLPEDWLSEITGRLQEKGLWPFSD